MGNWPTQVHMQRGHKTSVCPIIISGPRILTTGRITDGIFVVGKVYCNVTLDCFCSQPIGALVGSMWGNPNIRTIRCSAACRKIPTSFPSKVPLLSGIWTICNT